MTSSTAAPIPAGLDVLAEMVDMLMGIDAAISGLMAARSELLETARQWSETLESASPHSTPTSRDMAFRSLRAEVACALRLPERSVERLFGEARMLVRDLPATLTALHEGALSYRHAQVMVDQGSGLSAEHLATFERLAVPVGGSMTASAFDRKARRVRESLDSSTIEARTASAAERREASWSPGRDGMSDLILHMRTHDVQAIYSRATEGARALAGPNEPRTVAQLRVDLMRDALLTGTLDALGGTRLKPDVFVTVPVLTLLGVAEIPGDLDGYGPIAPSTARELAAHAPSFVRILTHPETGARLSVGRQRYATPSDLKNAMRAQHQTCGMPTCSTPAEFCDIDHIVDWVKDGTTSLTNLMFLCRGHHSLKHASAWCSSQDPGGSGVMTWRSPAGREYRKYPGGSPPA